MKCSLDKVLSDARLLATKMRSRDEEVEHILTNASKIQSRLENAQQYQEEVSSLSELADKVESRPRGKLVLYIAAENKQLEQLRQENEALQNALDEHQAALELIMSKYRTQLSRLTESKRMENYLSSLKCGESTVVQGPGNKSKRDPVISSLLDRMADVAAAVRMTNNQGDIIATEMESLVQRLVTENQALREMLQISYQQSTDGANQSTGQGDSKS